MTPTAEVKDLWDEVPATEVSHKDPFREIENIKTWCRGNGFEFVTSQVCERDSFGPVTVLIQATKNQQRYELLY